MAGKRIKVENLKVMCIKSQPSAHVIEENYRESERGNKVGIKGEKD